MGNGLEKIITAFQGEQSYICSNIKRFTLSFRPVFLYICVYCTKLCFPGLHCHSSPFDVHLKNQLCMCKIKCRHVFVAFKNICWDSPRLSWGLQKDGPQNCHRLTGSRNDCSPHLHSHHLPKGTLERQAFVLGAQQGGHVWPGGCSGGDWGLVWERSSYPSSFLRLMTSRQLMTCRRLLICPLGRVHGCSKQCQDLLQSGSTTMDFFFSC